MLQAPSLERKPSNLPGQQQPVQMNRGAWSDVTVWQSLNHMEKIISPLEAQMAPGIELSCPREIFLVILSGRQKFRGKKKKKKSNKENPYYSFLRDSGDAPVLLKPCCTEWSHTHLLITSGEIHVMPTKRKAGVRKYQLSFLSIILRTVYSDILVLSCDVFIH